MESGVIKTLEEFRRGRNVRLKYDFENPLYKDLLSKYDIEKTAGEGSELERAMRLTDEYAGRLTHKSNYDNSVPMNSAALLEYSLDNPKQGINCRNKAQILNEMCLALGIYARKVWLMPNSVYDGDCHVVNEVWDTKKQKWIMLDITSNTYWVDENGEPLSVLEIRGKISDQQFCTPVSPEDKLDNLQKSLGKNYGTFLYIAKNSVWFEYCAEYTVGEAERGYRLFPKNIDSDYRYFISEKAVNACPQ